MPMNFDPQKFFIGLIDFFSILLPGALLTYLLMGEVGLFVLGERYSKLAGAEAWAVFLFASYLFGHLVFLLGSWLDEFYDVLRHYTLNMVIMVIIRLGDILLHAADDDLLREATGLDNYSDWVQAEREFRLCHWKGMRI